MIKDDDYWLSQAEFQLKHIGIPLGFEGDIWDLAEKLKSINSNRNNKGNAPTSPSSKQ